MVRNKRKTKSSDTDTPPQTKKLKVDDENRASPARSEDSKNVVDKVRCGVRKSSSAGSSPQLRMPKIKTISKSGADETSFVTALEVQNFFLKN